MQVAAFVINLTDPSSPNDYCGEFARLPAGTAPAERRNSDAQWRIAQSSTILFGRGHFALVDSFRNGVASEVESF
jgi:hypothetical protein